MSQMGGKIDAGACLAKIPHDFAGGNYERSDERAGAMANIFVFAFFRFAWLGRDGGVLSLEDLHACFFVAANDQLAVLMQDRGLNVESANAMSLAVKIRIMAVEPIDAAMRFQVGLVQDAPNGRASHRFLGVAVDQDSSQLVHAPMTGHAVMLDGFAGRQRDDFELFVGGKSSGAGRSVERLEGPQDGVAESEFAKERRCCDCNSSHWLLVNSMVAPRRPSAKPAGNEVPAFVGSNGLGLMFGGALFHSSLR
jgi:hypothetical protein